MNEIAISGYEKLKVLKENDPYKEWDSLEETRFCGLCERTIKGLDIIVARDSGKPPRLSCPTPGCAGTPYDWVYLGDPLLSEEAYTEWERHLNASED